MASYTENFSHTGPDFSAESSEPSLNTSLHIHSDISAFEEMPALDAKDLFDVVPNTNPTTFLSNDDSFNTGGFQAQNFGTSSNTLSRNNMAYNNMSPTNTYE
jgi:hypothetical protein